MTVSTGTDREFSASFDHRASATYNTAIINRRLVSFADDLVRFRWNDYAHGGKRGAMTIEAIEFVRRFLLHVLPAGLVRVRHHGLLANRHCQEKLGRCLEVLGAAATPQADTAPSEPDPVTQPRHESTVAPTRVCSGCGAGRMVVVAEFPPMSLAEWIAAGLVPCLILDCS